MKLRLLIGETKGFSQAARAQLEQHFEVDLMEIQQNSVGQALEEYDIFWFRLGFRIGAGQLPDSPRCRIIVCQATGLDHIDEAACQMKGIEIISLRGEAVFLRSVRATAELTVGLALALLRKIPQAALHVQEGGWDRDQFQGQELLGKTVGIVGVGRLGKMCAQYFLAFGCTVIAYDPIPFDIPGVEPFPSLETLVPKADLLSVHISYNPLNHHLFDDNLFSKFKPGSIFINTSRGGVVDSASLIRQIESGHLAAAALDVIENEHEHQSSELVAFAKRSNNLLITPHIGGNTKESFEKTELFLAQKLMAKEFP